MMKRKIEICRKCRNFCEGAEGMECLLSASHLLRFLKHFGSSMDFFSNINWISPGGKCDFEKNSIPKNCEMKDIYFMDKWNNQAKRNKSNGHS